MGLKCSKICEGHASHRDTRVLGQVPVVGRQIRR